MDPDTLKHLELVQGVVSRMGGNSFAVKSWAVGLIAGLLALASQRDGSALIAVGYLPVIVFWYLDAFYLRQERLFRRLYNAVRLGDEVVKKAGPFTMSTRDFEGEPEMSLRVVALSPTVTIVYMLLAVLITVALIISSMKGVT